MRFSLVIRSQVRVMSDQWRVSLNMIMLQNVSNISYVMQYQSPWNKVIFRAWIIYFFSDKSIPSKITQNDKRCKVLSHGPGGGKKGPRRST